MCSMRGIKTRLKFSFFYVKYTRLGLFSSINKETKMSSRHNVVTNLTIRIKYLQYTIFLILPMSCFIVS